MKQDNKINCLFIVPTIMTRPEYEISNVEHLASTFPNDRVLFISNVEDEDFSNYQPSQPNIEKYISNKLYSISKAINTGIDKIQDEEYICFIQSDIRISYNVIDCCKQIADAPTLNAGIVGTTPHSNFHRFSKLLSDNIDGHGQKLYNVLWADGIMFWSTKILHQIGMFNEEYFGDRESQEYCYRAHDVGYSNYYFTIAREMFYETRQLPFSSKTKYDSKEFLAIVNDTDKRFREQWYPWQDEQDYRFK